MRYLKLAILIFVYALTSPAFAGPQPNNDTCASPDCKIAIRGPTDTCPSWFPTKASQVVGVNTCIQDLAQTAIFVVCGFLEDDAGKAADKYTALTCPERQAALAAQCRSRCERYVDNARICNRTQTWNDAFGDIGGTMIGSARVDLCGPPLKFKVGITNIRKVPKKPPPHL